jgi:hypothetical protein
VSAYEFVHFFIDVRYTYRYVSSLSVCSQCARNSCHQLHSHSLICAHSQMPSSVCTFHKVRARCIPGPSHFRRRRDGKLPLPHNERGVLAALWLEQHVDKQRVRAHVWRRGSFVGSELSSRTIRTVGPHVPQQHGSRAGRSIGLPVTVQWNLAW